MVKNTSAMHETACRRPGFNPWVRKVPWRWKWQPIPVFLPGESHGQRSLVGYIQFMVSQESDKTEGLNHPHVSHTSL